MINRRIPFHRPSRPPFHVLKDHGFCCQGAKFYASPGEGPIDGGLPEVHYRFLINQRHLSQCGFALTPSIHESHNPVKLVLPPILLDGYPTDRGWGRRLWELQFEAHQVLIRTLGIVSL